MNEFEERIKEVRAALYMCKGYFMGKKFEAGESWHEGDETISDAISAAAEKMNAISISFRRLDGPKGGTVTFVEADSSDVGSR